ncbi:MAG TPA: OmpA family protein [Bdellovibrionota bacterium]|jgi:outer membrane protein OmpA-like peptidoglycan-associated protein
MRFLFLFVGLAYTLQASADSVNVQLFKSPFNLNYGMVESSIHDGLPWDEAAPRPKYFASADYHYVKDPLVVINTTTNTRIRALVNNVHTMDLAGGYFFSPATSVYLQMPLNYANLPGGTNQFGLGDSRAAGKFTLSETAGGLSFSVMPELVLPTGDKARFLSDDGLGAGVLLIAEQNFGTFRLTGNAGYLRSGRASYPGIDYRNRVPLGLGAAIPVARQWAINLEGKGAIAIPASQRQNASEFYAGLNYHPVKHVAAILGGSLGAFDKAGSSDYRVQAAVRVYFDEGRHERPAPIEEPPPPPKPAPKARMVEDKIEILEEIQFEHNKDRLMSHSKKVLDEVADIIRAHADGIKYVEVEGHTSHPGTDAYNLKLSMRRARAVVSYLTIEQKIPARMLKAKGYGESRPKFKPGKATPAQLELNRRVEFNVIRNKP